MYRSEGLTLVEMMCSTALIAIVTVLAAPTFVDMRYDAERTTTVNNFFHSLFLARSESIKRGEVVSVCRSSDGQTCSTGKAPWQVGWIVFVNDDREEPAERDPEESLLAVHQGWPAGTITSNRSTYSFRPQVQGVINGTIVFCDPRGTEYARAIIISHTGRPRVARKDASGKPLKCEMP
jgi:type IV fimbrial biogenesis protein FimT